jgi:hypothetical protein
MAHEAQLAHVTTGRLRLRLPHLKGDVAALGDIRGALMGIDGVRAVEVNPVTAGLLILHSNAQEHILSVAAELGLFTLKDKKSEKEKSEKNSSVLFSGNVAVTARLINDKIKALTGRELDLSSLFFMTLFGAGVYQVARGNFALPAWYTAFWYAYGVISKNIPKL